MAGCSGAVVPEVSKDELYESAVMAGDYLARHVNEDGSFVYEYDAGEDRDLGGYNILRHGGTTYSMAELYKVTRDPELLEAMTRAIQYLDAQIEMCVEGPIDARCVVERGAVKVGGNALAILAMVEFMEATETDQYLERAQQLARWIQSVQGEDGRFEVHKQNVVTGERLGFRSEYYPGEAIFALTRLHDLDGNEAWLDVAEANATYLIEVRDAGLDIDELIHDHWLLYGLNELYRERPEHRYLKHAERTAKAIVGAQRRAGDAANYPPIWEGSYYTPPRSTPTATRTEGLLAAHALMRDFGSMLMVREIEEAIWAGIGFQLRTQIQEANRVAVADFEQARGGFRVNLNGYQVRIDYVQHNLSALLGAWELL